MEEIDLDSIKAAMRDYDNDLAENFDLTYEKLELESDSSRKDYLFAKKTKKRYAHFPKYD